MSKLTPEQKAANKEAMRLRNKAFNVRLKAYRSEREAAEAAVANSPSGIKQTASSQALEAALVRRKEALDAITRQITALQKKLVETEKEFENELEALRAARVQANQEFNRAREEAEAAVDSRYLDMVGCWSAAAWKPLERFLPDAAEQSADGQGG